MEPDFDRLPNVFVIGAPKAGTTTLHALLAQHPSVFVSKKKELRFFNKEKYFNRGLGWYVSTHFRDAERYPVRVESTPTYLTWSETAAERIHRTYGDRPIKLIVIFRDPVARAYSHYWFRHRLGREDAPTFARALELEEQRLQRQGAKLERSGSGAYGYLRASRYASRMEPFLRRFPASSFLFLLQEDLRQFEETARRIFAFLGVDETFVPTREHSNAAGSPRNVRIYRALERLLKWVGRRPEQIRFLKPFTVRAEAYPPIDPALELALRRQLEPEIRALESICGRDLSDWLAEEPSEPRAQAAKGR